jgi:hypothetical protein
MKENMSNVSDDLGGFWWLPGVVQHPGEH